jgi:protein phosphatase 1L
MMVDSDSTDTRGPTVDLLKEKEDDGGFVSGWWKRLVLGSVICYCVCFW